MGAPVLYPPQQVDDVIIVCKGEGGALMTWMLALRHLPYVLTFWWIWQEHWLTTQKAGGPSTYLNTSANICSRSLSKSIFLMSGWGWLWFIQFCGLNMKCHLQVHAFKCLVSRWWHCFGGPWKPLDMEPLTHIDGLALSTDSTWVLSASGLPDQSFQCHTGMPLLTAWLSCHDELYPLNKPFLLSVASYGLFGQSN